jgi:hypothetical protein
MALGPRGLPPPMSTPRPVTPDSADGFIPRHAAGSGVGGPPSPPGVGRYIPRFSDEVTLTREGVNRNEQTIQHERFPWYDQDYMTSNHDTLVNWTDCGPIRPSLHNRQETINRQVGTSATRNFDPRPINSYGTQDQGHGFHTNPEPYKASTNRNFRNRQQQQPARINRLSPAVYTGQSYSQTTTIQGGAR